ncbi:MAG: GNAT family N-acetyltransferase [Firmicutes bacterium]|nr:GNAT family N-acetyltransferase [Bacillota bacterium]
MKTNYDCMIHHQLLKKEILKGPVVDLKLLNFYEKDSKDLPFYCFQIILANKSIGKITLRLGFNEMTALHGHVGYGIDEAFRGNNYAYYALEMIKELAVEHGYRKLLVTTDARNEQSIRTILKSDGKLIELEKKVPNDHIYFVLGIKELNIYEISL